MRSGLAVSGASGGAVSSTSTPTGRSLVVSAVPASAAASRIERLRRHRENIRRCARELGVDLQASRSATAAAQADPEELAVIGSATGHQRGARRVALRTHASQVARDALEHGAIGHGVGNSEANRGSSIRTSTEVARTRLRPSQTPEAVLDERVMSSPSSGMIALETQPAGAGAGNFERHRLDPPSMMDDIYEVHGVLMQNLEPYVQEAPRPSAEAARSKAELDAEHTLNSLLHRPERDWHHDDLSTGSLSQGALAMHEMNRLFGDAHNPVSVPCMTKADDYAIAVATASPDMTEELPVVDARASPDLTLKSHHSSLASPAGGSQWAETSALLEDSRCQDEQVDELPASWADSHSAGLPLVASPKALESEPTTTDLTFGGILDRWRQQYSEFQHALDHVSATPSGHGKLPASINEDLGPSNLAATGALADEDPEMVLQRIKRDLGLEASPLANEMEMIGSKDLGLLLSETSSAPSDSILEGLHNDLHEFDQMREPTTSWQVEALGLSKLEDTGAIAADASSTEHLSKFHLGLLNGFESEAKDSVDRFSEHLHVGPASTSCGDAEPKSASSDGPSEAVLARLQALEAEFLELRKKHATSDGVNTKSPPPSPKRPPEKQAVPTGDGAEQLRSSLATLLSSTASSVFGARSEMPSARSPATGLDPSAGCIASKPDTAPEVGFSLVAADDATVSASFCAETVAQVPLEEAKELEEVVLQASPVQTPAVIADRETGSEQAVTKFSPPPSSAIMINAESRSEEVLANFSPMSPTEVKADIGSKLDTAACGSSVLPGASSLCTSEWPLGTEDGNSAPAREAAVSVDQHEAQIQAPLLPSDNVARRADIVEEKIRVDELPQLVAAGAAIAGRAEDAAVGVSEMQASPHFGLGISMMDKLFAEAKSAESATQTSFTQTSPRQAAPEPIGSLKRPPLAAMGAAQAWDGSGDAYFPTDRWRRGLAPSDYLAPSGYRTSQAGPSDFALPPNHLGFLAGSSGGVHPNIRYPVTNGAPPTPPMSPRVVQSGGRLHGLASHPEQQLYAASAGLPSYSERRQLLPPTLMEGAAIGSREDDQLLLRAYEVYRKQQLELLRPA